MSCRWLSKQPFPVFKIHLCLSYYAESPAMKFDPPPPPPINTATPLIRSNLCGPMVALLTRFHCTMTHIAFIFSELRSEGGGGGLGRQIPHSRRRPKKSGLNRVRNSGNQRKPSNFHTVLIRYIWGIFYAHSVLHPNGQVLSRTFLASVSLLH